MGAIAENITIGGDVYEKREGINLEIQVSVLGYKIIRDWEETRDLPEAKITTHNKEKRHVWTVFYYTTEGKKVAVMDMAEPWEPVVDLSGKPTEIRQPENTEAKPQPFVRMFVSKQVE